MPAFGIVLLVAALWWLQGIGFVRWLLPSLREQPVVELVMAMWLGALASLVLVLELYYVVPAATIEQLAWPVTLVLASGSVALFARSKRGPRRLDAASIAIVAVSLVGVLLVLRPLLGTSHLGYYSQNNGEFANYAVLGDMVKHHDASTAVGSLGLRSREAVSSIHTALLSSLTGIGVFWLTQPVAAAFALLGFGALGVAFRRIALSHRASPVVLLVLAGLYTWAAWSSTAQCFWTLSFVSQYLCVALWFGGFVLVLEAPIDRARTALLGLMLGALACVYPEMLVPCAGLIAIAELARAPSRTTVRRVLIAAAIAVVVANALGYELVIARGGVSGGGWNIFGNHTHPLEFFASIAGLANPFTATSAHPIVAWTAVLVFGAGLAWSIRDLRRGDLRVIGASTCAFAIGIIGIFALVARRGDHINYIALKLLLNFAWLGYLAIGVVFAAMPRLAIAGLVAIAVVWFDVGRSAYRFTKLQHQAAKTSLYNRADAEAVRARLDDRPYIAASWFDTYIIGQFMVYDEDLFGELGRWPDPSSQARAPAKWILFMNDFDPAKDPKLGGHQFGTVLTGRHVRLAAFK